MNATIAVRPHHSVRWIGGVLLVAAIVATVVLTLAVFTGNDAPATPKPAPAAPHSGVDTGCVHVGAAMKAC
jgi:hypothetical protein